MSGTAMMRPLAASQRSPAAPRSRVGALPARWVSIGGEGGPIPSSSLTAEQSRHRTSEVTAETAQPAWGWAGNIRWPAEAGDTVASGAAMRNSPCHGCRCLGRRRAFGRGRGGMGWGAPLYGPCLHTRMARTPPWDAARRQEIFAFFLRGRERAPPGFAQKRKE